MKRKNEIKLGALSRIDDEIIDRNTEKRCRLIHLIYKGSKVKKRILVTAVSFAAVLALLASVFLVLFLLPSGQVPVYQGMTVSSEAPVTQNSEVLASNGIKLLSAGSGLGYSFDLLDEKEHGVGNNNGNGVVGNGEKRPVEDIIEDSLVVEGSAEEMYYANKNQDIYITIHINNPDRFEILSFTLNDEKYSSYMFEAGSDLENLILKVNVGDKEGILEYTIDAIKYVDGTEIKDVVMEGDRTVKVGVYPENQPDVNINNAVAGINKLTFSVLVDDPSALIDASEGKVKAAVFDDSSLVAEQDIPLGEQTEVIFEGLRPDTEYRYAIIAYYDALDGDGFASHIISAAEIRTQGVVAFDSVSIGQESFSFSLVWNEQHADKNVENISLYLGEEKVADISPETLSISGLMSNTEYTAVISYLDLGNTETVSLTFTTQSKAAPTGRIYSTESTLYTISGSYRIDDPDLTVTSEKIELYLGDTLIEDKVGGSFEFSSLDYYKNYTLKLTYTYDLNDGTGSQTVTYSKSLYTQPYVAVTSCDVANVGAVSEGDTIYMELGLDNPCDGKISQVKVNGNYYSTNNTSASRVFVEIINDGQFRGGDTELTVEGIKITLNGVEYTVAVDNSPSASVFINGKLEVLRFEYVNEDLEPIDYAFEDETVYLLLTLDNPTGYDIDSVTIQSYDSSPKIITDINKIDDNRYYFEISRLDTTSYYDLTSINYSNHDASLTLSGINMNTTCYWLGQLRSEVVYISTPEDLLDMDDGYYYELTNDIDLAGRNWQGRNFNGVFNGNGYSIKNLSYVGTITNINSNLGLFSGAYGVIENLNMESVKFVVTLDGTIMNCGAICAAGNGVVRSCTVDASSVFSVKDNDSSSGSTFIGGLVGHMSSGRIESCTNYGEITGTIGVGGIAGSFRGNSNAAIAIINQCTNYGEVLGETSVGGIVGDGTIGVNVTDCTNYGNISGKLYNIGGIAGIGKATNCTNSGSVTGTNWVGGITGSGNAIDCTNNGKVIKKEYEE